ncbi:hypothetical protein EU527_01340 [Candidatus Thorarchaeota archaeon]|nr:MAG: hypothetical protein EU527_01340 [Candidatus Thorarchaeota archaeon]
MRRTSRLLALIFVTFMILGSTQIQTITPDINGNQPVSASLDILKTAAYDSPNITAMVLSPANGTAVSMTFDISLNMTSDFVTLNLTLFIDGTIYPVYNETPIVASPNWIQNISVDSSSLGDTWHNFTVFFENLAERESVYLLYYVDNTEPNFVISLISPANQTTISGIVSINLNIISDYDLFNVTVFVDGNVKSFQWIGTGNVSVVIDTSTLLEGYDNFTLLFQYDMLQIHFEYALYLVYLVDNDGVPITISHLEPANQTEIYGTFDLVLLIGSEYEPLNLTLFVNGEISQYNKSSIGIKQQTISIDTLPFDEGLANFTLLFEYNVTGEDARVVYHLVFLIDNHDKPVIIILDPSADSTVTGLTDFWLNISSTHPDLFLNITVDGKIVEEYNATIISVGAFNYTLNTSRYENGNHVIAITAFTGEGEFRTVERNLIFLDYVRVWISGVTSHDRIFGEAEITVRMESAFTNATMSLYVDNVLAEDVTNITIYPGNNKIKFDTTVFPEGEQTVKVIAYDEFGHLWITNMILEVDNKGAPTLRFITRDAVVVGLASFELDVESDWDEVLVIIYVDDNIVNSYNNLTIDVSSGSFIFQIDVGNYAKTEHAVRVVMTTPEGDASEVERTFGFASLRAEEILSIGVLFGLAIFIPFYRWRKGGQSIKTVLIVDSIFLAVVIGAFILLGINTIPFITWHVNLASIWAIGGILVFTNWALPFLTEES